MNSILAWLIKVFNKLGDLYKLTQQLVQDQDTELEDLQQILVNQQQAQLDIDTIKDQLTEIESVLAVIKKVLGVGVPVVEIIQFQGVQPNMPATITDIQTVAVAGIAATDAANEAVAVDTTKVTWSVGDPTLLTITLDGTTGLPTFGFNTGVFTGTLPATSQVSGLDTVNNLTSTDTITVNTSAATTEVIQFAPPTP